MALFNEILVGRFNRGVQKLTGMKGQAPAPQLAAEIMAQFDLDNPSPENFYLLSWQRFGQQTTTTSPAGATAGVRLRNPSGSNVIALVERVVYNNNAAVDEINLQLNAIATDLASVGVLTAARMDPRGNPQPTLVMSSSTGATGATSIGGTKLAFNGAINTTFDVCQFMPTLIPILPGDALQILGNTNGQSWHASIWWRERYLEESERA